MYYNDFILDELKSKGATLVGFADLSEIDIEIRRGFRYGVLIAITVNPFIISRIPSGPHIEYYDEVNIINEKLQKLSLYTEKIISDKGFKALSEANVKQDNNFSTNLPYKTVAFKLTWGTCGKCIAVCPYTKRYIKPFLKDN